MTFRLPAFILLVTVIAACADPPSKEMNQAQGAIDTARAAGAEEYAPNELNAAIAALKQSEAAAAQRDYRLALNHAIDSRERAQVAAKTAVVASGRARGELEAQLAEATALLAQARDKLRDPATARVPRHTLAALRATIDAASRSLQEARTALKNDDYPGARRALQGQTKKIRAVIAEIEQSTAPSFMRRRH